MNKFQKLYQINKDIELLEKAGKIKAANVLHNKFIKEAQYAMPQMMPMMMPQMMMPQMMSQMMPMMMARPVAPVAPAAAARPVVTPAPMPVAQPRTTPVQTIGTPNPGVSPAPSPAPAPKPSPGNMQIAPLPSPAPGGQVQPPYEGSYTNPGGQNVPPPTPPPTQYGDKNKKDQELQYLENELQRLQREHGMDCGPFAAQCNTLRGMIDKNKGGSVVKG